LSASAETDKFGIGGIKGIIWQVNSFKFRINVCDNPADCLLLLNHFNNFYVGKYPMQIKKKIFLVLISLSLLSSLYAQSNDPANTSSYTLEDLYDLLNSGATVTQSTFTEPSSGPGSTMYTLNEIMGIAPTVDISNGATTAQVVKDKTFWGLRTDDGTWGLKTGEMYPAPVPKTGQTTGYATGDDGDLEKGVAWPNPRFTDNGNGTVTDNLTGLIWLKNANPDGTKTWNNAIVYCNSLADGTAGLSDASTAGEWRLPNVRELLTLIDFSKGDPDVPLPTDHPFTGVANYFNYWTNTTFAANSSYAWFISMNTGAGSATWKTSTYYIWAVRGGE